MNLAAAIRYATNAHDGQVRKYTNEPFIHHPLRVMYAVILDPILGALNEPAMAAVLHDVVEDTDYCLGNVWGENVISVVGELTNEFTKERYPTLNRVQRKHREFSRLSQVSLTAKIIKLYDRLDNIQDLFHEGVPPDFRWFYAGETLELVEMIDCAQEILVNKVRETAERLLRMQ